ncbi:MULTISPECIES: homoserine kinase [unclassified Blastococcus]
MTPARSAVRVRVPATSANLGPAFDCAGLALSCADELEFTVTDGGLTVAMTGEGAGTLPADESHLVVRAFRAACAQLGWTPPGLRLATVNAIPQGRGMGSSAAAVVGGLVAAWALCPDAGDVDPDAVLRLATEFEGHADNVAACLHGGLVLAVDGDRGPVAERLDVHPEIQPLLLVPGGTLSTEAARGLLPDVVPHRDAAFNAGRAALLVAALTADPGLLLPATEDRLHQRQRAAAMPESLALVDRLRAEGLAAVVSGAGPSVLVLTRRDPADDPADPAEGVAVRRVADLTPAGWRLLPLTVDGAGARVLAATQVTS